MAAATSMGVRDCWEHPHNVEARQSDPSKRCRNFSRGCLMEGVDRGAGHPGDGVCNWCLAGHPIPGDRAREVEGVTASDGGRSVEL